MLSFRKTDEPTASAGLGQLLIGALMLGVGLALAGGLKNGLGKFFGVVVAVGGIWVALDSVLASPLSGGGLLFAVALIGLGLGLINRRSQVLGGLVLIVGVFALIGTGALPTAEGVPNAVTVIWNGTWEGVDTALTRANDGFNRIFGP